MIAIKLPNGIEFGGILTAKLKSIITVPRKSSKIMEQIDLKIYNYLCILKIVCNVPCSNFLRLSVI